MNTIREGTRVESIQPALLEHFNPGQKVTLYLRLARPLTEQELQSWAGQAGISGAKMTYGSVPGWGWDDTVRLDFTRPSRTDGYGFSWTLAFILGIPAIIVAWKLSAAVQSNFQALAIITGLVVIAVVAIKQKRTGGV